MSDHAHDGYGQAVEAYLAGSGDAALTRAHDLGRAALLGGGDVLDLIAVHHEVLAELLTSGHDPALAVRGAHAVLVEALAPFELARRELATGNDALRRLNETLEAEARRIVHAHDDAGQLLATVNLALADLLREHPRCAPSAARIHQLLDAMESHLRLMSHELRPTALDDLGLVPALELLAGGVRARGGVEVVVRGSTRGRLPAALELALYRTVQEALSDVVDHAGARSASVEVERGLDAVRCAISDDGRDLPDSRPARAGVGLVRIRERLACVGGSVRFVTRPSGGNSIEASVPLLEVADAPAADRG